MQSLTDLVEIFFSGLQGCLLLLLSLFCIIASSSEGEEDECDENLPEPVCSQDSSKVLSVFNELVALAKSGREETASDLSRQMLWPLCPLR